MASSAALPKYQEQSVKDLSRLNLLKGIIIDEWLASADVEDENKQTDKGCPPSLLSSIAIAFRQENQ
jgi:hypothetical protein